MKTKSSLKNIFFTILVVIGVNTTQIYTLYQTRKFGSINFFAIEDHVFGLLTCLLALISSYLSWQIISKKQFKNTQKIILSFALSLLIFAVFTSLFFISYRYLVHGLPTSTWLLIGNIAFGVTTYHLYTCGFTLIYLYFNDSKKLELDIVRLEREKEIFKSKMLQKNLEPHFLFNNLSVLSSLSHKNPEDLENFIDDFSGVYRYFLDHYEQEIVPLSEELEFTKRYRNLIEKRFNNAYKIVSSINDTTGFILPCTLQLGIENAIKHNKASEENPLIIELYRNENTIFIKNKLNTIQQLNSSKLGNQYLKKHYKLMFNLDVIFTKTENEYCVAIPLIY
jgi:two-component system LytT family sensor kinase